RARPGAPGRHRGAAGDQLGCRQAHGRERAAEMRAYEIGLGGHVRRLWLYALVGLVLAFLVLPTLIVVPMSFSDGNFLRFPPEQFSLRWYQAYVTSPVWLDATRISVSVAVMTAAIATPIGTAA